MSRLPERTQPGREKRGADPTGARMLALTREAMAFTPADGETSRTVLRRIMASDNEKEARLASERVRDELGLTRVVKPTETHHLHVTLEPWVGELASQHRAPANRLDQHTTRVTLNLPALPGA